MTKTDPRAKLDALLSLINSAAQEAIAEYERTNEGLPTLDVPHPNDLRSDSLGLRKAIRTLEGACDQLCSTLAQPAHTMVNRGMALFEPACIRVAVEARVADILLDHPDGAHVNELSKRTGIEAKKLGRILRLLATKHCFCEVAPDVFKNNRLSRALATDQFAYILEYATNECSRAPTALSQALVDPEYAMSYESSKAPFLYAVKEEGDFKSFFDWFNAHPDRDECYDRAMINWATIINTNAVIDNFVWKDFPVGTTVCDVAGGMGSLSLELARLYPHLLLTLQDVPETIDHAKVLWNKEHREFVANERVKFVPLDFFKESPVIGQDVYFMRNIIHDWPDAEALTILHNVRRAMRPDSRLFIQDIVLQHLQENPGSDISASVGRLEVAPKPLLPSYGAGSIRMYNMDVHMLFVTNAQERTLQESDALGAQAGLRLVNVWDFVESSVLEFRLT